MPFLTIYVPTYKRPKLLNRCLASIAGQYDFDLQTVIVEDKVGIGIDGMYADIANHVDEVEGEYVFILSDDNVITDAEFVRNLKRIGKTANSDVIVFKNEINGHVYPDIWNAAPVCGHIDLSCFAVKADIWKANADKWGKCYEGDYHFIRSLWDQGFSFFWWDNTPIRALQVSKGAPE